MLIATSDDEEAVAILSGHRGDRPDRRRPRGIPRRAPARRRIRRATDDISRRLTEGGLAIRRFERTRTSLEQRFLEVTS